MKCVVVVVVVVGVVVVLSECDNFVIEFLSF
jgi:hypothetical protein